MSVEIITWTYSKVVLDNTPASDEGRFFLPVLSLSFPLLLHIVTFKE